MMMMMGMRMRMMRGGKGRRWYKRLIEEDN